MTRPTALLAVAFACLAASQATAQFSPWGTFPLQHVDARVLPAGVLRIGFLPSYANYDERFGADGAAERLGSDLTTDSLGSNLLILLRAGEREVREVTGDSTYRMTLGPITTRLDADVRRIPLDLALGLTDRITLTARVSLVKTRMQAFVTLDTTKANVGWNQLSTQANNTAGAVQITTLIAQLGAAIKSLVDQIASGGFGCPGSASCVQATATLNRALTLQGSLTVLTTGTGASAITPVVPLNTSPAGIAISAEVGKVIAALQALGLGPIGGSLVLPTKTLTGADFQKLLAAPEFGYELRPIATTDISRLGDTEIGLRVAVIQEPAFRLTLSAVARLPTATRDSIAHVVDLGTGDRQLDAELGIETAFDPPGGVVGLAAGAWYHRQFADDLRIRWPLDGPLAPRRGPEDEQFHRDLGDVFQAAAYPSLRLNDAFRVFGSAYYFHKSRDELDCSTCAAPADFGAGSDQRALFLGAGIHYRAERTATGATRLPVEAGLSYQAAFSGRGGTTPKTTILNLYLRLHYRIFD